MTYGIHMSRTKSIRPSTHNILYTISIKQNIYLDNALTSGKITTGVLI